jgi:hypothetical protein
MRLFNSVVTRQEKRLFERLPSTSRSSTIGKGGKHGWGIYAQLSLSGSSMQGRWPHERYFVSTIDIRGQGVSNAQPFREELDRAFEYLAMEIVRVLSNIQTPLDPPSSHLIEIKQC